MSEVMALMIVFSLFVLALLALVLTFSRLHWGIKLLMILLTIAFYFVSYHGWKQLQGWPSSTPMPEKFLLHAAVIEEPDKEKGFDGTIYIWATDLKDQMPAHQPRAYELSYEQGLHKKLEAAIRQMRNGSVQLGISKSSNNPEMAIKAKRLGEKSQIIEFSDLPDPALPEK